MTRDLLSCAAAFTVGCLVGLLILHVSGVA